MACVKWKQVAISGIAEDKVLNDAESKRVRRKSLEDFIQLKLHLQQQEFAQMLNVSAATITKWLYSDTVPSVFTMRRMAVQFGMDFDEVLKLFETNK